MSKNIVIAKEVLKELVNVLTPFKNGKNTICFQIGAGMAGEENVKCYATLVNGSMQQKALFVVKKPGDYVEGELYSSFNAKAETFLAFANAFLEYNQDVQLELADASTTFRVTSGNNAEISIPTVADDQLEPPIPAVNKNLQVLTISTDAEKLRGLLRKGAFLAMANDTRGITDRGFFVAEEKALSVTSTDASSIASATAEAQIMLNKVVLAALALSEMTEKIRDEDERTAFEKETEAAFTSGTLEKVAEEKGVDLNTFNFALTKNAIDTLKAILKGGQVSMILDDKHLYVKNGNTLSAYTLADASKYVSFKDMISKFDAVEVAAKVVLDSEQMTKAINILSLKDSLGKNEHPNPFAIKAKKGALVLDYDGDMSNLALTESDGELKKIKANVMGMPLKNIIGSLDKGNLVLTFPAEEKLLCGLKMVRSLETTGRSST